MSTNIEQVREQLLETLKDLRNRDNPMEPDRARAIAQIAGVLVDSARVEVEFIKATDGQDSNFLKPGASAALPAPGADNRTHRLR